MSVLRNPKWERFAQELAKGKTMTAAYKAAGYRGDRKKASRLGTNGDVQGRVAELQGLAAKKTVVTVESLICEAEMARALAMKIKQPSAAVAAVKAKADIAGVGAPQRVEADVKQHFVGRPKPETREEFEARRRGELGMGTPARPANGSALR